MPEPTVVGKTTKWDHPSLWVSFKLSYLFWRKSAVTHKIQPEKQPFGIFRLVRILNRHHNETLFHPYSRGLFVSTFALFILGPFVLATSPLFAAVTEFTWPGTSHTLPLLHIQLAHVTSRSGTEWDLFVFVWYLALQGHFLGYSSRN